jgi:hypothetical protein
LGAGEGDRQRRFHDLRSSHLRSTRAGALRRDECGDWRISGIYGCVCAVPVASGIGYQLTVMQDIDDARPWNVAKRKLDFAKVTQNGDSRRRPDPRPPTDLS